MKKKKEVSFVPLWDDPRVGTLVLSVAGHDAGIVHAVVAGIDRETVLIADGRRRRISTPKKKKMQHILSIARLSEEETELLRERKANDSFLRRVISAFDIETLT